MPSEQLRVAVLRGGVSAEHEISMMSGEAVLQALRARGVVALDVRIGSDGVWRTDAGTLGDVLAGVAHVRANADLVFPALHGPFGEDGVIQGVLDAAGVPYVGSGVRASALAMDKGLSRRIARTLDVDVAPAVEGGPIEDEREMAAFVQSVTRLQGPWFVKPVASGSSVAVTRVEHEKSLRDSIGRALAECERVIVESAVSGLEVSCPVLGDAGSGARALPVIEIAPRTATFFDYAAKYTEGETDEICPARIPDDVARRIQLAARRIHETFGCLDLSRSDFIVPDDGEPVFLEVNTLPGLTPLSLFPKAATAAGMDYPSLIRVLVEGAWGRWRRLKSR